MHVRCPHCHQAVELVENVGLEHIDCPSCGSDFSLLGEPTTAARSIGSVISTTPSVEITGARSWPRLITRLRREIESLDGDLI